MKVLIPNNCYPDIADIADILETRSYNVKEPHSKYWVLRKLKYNKKKLKTGCGNSLRLLAYLPTNLKAFEITCMHAILKCSVPREFRIFQKVWCAFG